MLNEVWPARSRQSVARIAGKLWIARPEQVENSLAGDSGAFQTFDRLPQHRMTHPLSDLRPGEVVGTLPNRADAQLQFIGRIRTPWAQTRDCPKRGDEVSGPVCQLMLEEGLAPALKGLAPGDRMIVLYWMHLARRDLLQQSPRSDGQTMGTFAIRSPIRPNPIALSYVRLLGIDGMILSVRGLDCVDGTPLLDIKSEFCALQGSHP